MTLPNADRSGGGHPRTGDKTHTHQRHAHRNGTGSFRLDGGLVRPGSVAHRRRLERVERRRAYIAECRAIIESAETIIAEPAP